jgi:hypothetical protein
MHQPSWEVVSGPIFPAVCSVNAGFGVVFQVCFSEGGERFAAIGQGGMGAAWRLDAPTYTRSDSGPLARSDWCHQVGLLLLALPSWRAPGES